MIAGLILLAVFAAEDTARALHAAGGTGTTFRTQARPGAQILRQMLEETPCDGVVVEPNGRASCRLDRALIAEALAAGADDYVMKPFDGEILQSKLTEVGAIAA